MQNWTYVGTADFGSNSGVSLNGYVFNEVLVIASVNDFEVYYGPTPETQQLLTDTPSFEFYWIPVLGQVQLSQTAHQEDFNHLLITVSFSSTNVRTHTVLVVDPNTGNTTDYNTAEYGHFDVYCR